MSSITLKLKLKKHIIDVDRYEEYIYIHNICYSLFKDGPGNYAISVDGGVFMRSGISRKKEALKLLSDNIMAH